MSDQPIFSVVWKQMLEAKNLRELDQVAQQIGLVYNLAHQAELSALCTSLKADLNRKEKNVLPQGN